MLVALTASRRTFLKGGAGALAGLSLQESLLRVLAAPSPCGTIGDIEHVVVLMQENRSFDHYFGRYPGVRGFDDRSVLTSIGDDGTGVFKQAYPSGAIPGAPNPLLPFHIETALSTHQGECVNDIDHQWSTQHAMWNQGAMDRWVAQHLVTDPAAAGRFAAITMGYYQGSHARDHSGDVDLYWALADNFTICDGFHSSVIGGTDINRLYSMTGTCDPDGWDGGLQFVDTQVTGRPGFFGTFGAAGKWQTYPELLQAAGISWRIYGTPDGQLGDNVLPYFQAYGQPTGTRCWRRSAPWQ